MKISFAVSNPLGHVISTRVFWGIGVGVERWYSWDDEVDGENSEIDFKLARIAVVFYFLPFKLYMNIHLDD